MKSEVSKMRLIDADKGLISKIQRKTGCNFITAQKIVDSMPTVEERKVGKWIGEEEGYYSECSCCGASFLWEDYKCIGDWKYCPNCGAEMRGAENDC